MATPQPSRRERNRQEAWTAIQEAASAAALEGGLAAATVDVIVARAGVSRRTFFNYFHTKEDAILGLREPFLADDAVAAFRAAGREVVGDAVHLMAAVMRTAGPAGMADQRPRTVLQRVPELLTRLQQHVTDVQQLVEPLIAERLHGEPGEHGGPGEPGEPGEGGEPSAARQERVTIVKMLAGTILQYAYATELAAVVAGDSAAIDRAIDAFRAVSGTAL